MPEDRSALVLKSVSDGIATLTLHRPHRNNAWTTELGSAYFDRLEECQADPDVRVLVVTGAGKSFCPGVDMDNLSAASKGDQSALSIGEAEPDRRPTELAMLIGKPVIAAINGACAGLGLVHTLYMDVRFAVRGAKLTFAFSRRGLIAEYGASWILPRIVGEARARDLLLSSRVVMADDAERMGLVNFVSEPDRLMDDVYAYARDLAQSCSPQSFAIMKRQLHGDVERPLSEAVERAIRLMVWSLKQRDFTEGVASFVQRRPPMFPAHTGTTGDPYENAER